MGKMDVSRCRGFSGVFFERTCDHADGPGDAIQCKYFPTRGYRGEFSSGLLPSDIILM